MKSKSFFARLLKWASIGLVLVVVLLAALFAVLQTRPAKDRLAALLTRLLSPSPDSRMEFQGLGGFLPLEIDLERFAMSDGQGEWLAVENVRLRWSPAALLKGRIRISEVGAGAVRLDRLPPSAPEEEGPSEAGFPSVTLPTGLPPVDVEVIAVEELALGAPVLGEPAVFRLRGSVRPVEEGPGLAAALDLRRTDAPLPKASLEASLRGDPGNLGLSLALEEASAGLLARKLGMSDAGDLSLAFRGQGPLSNWNGRLDFKAGSWGEAGLTLDLAMGAERIGLGCRGEVRAEPALLPPAVAPVVGESSRLNLAAVMTPESVDIEELHLETAGPSLHLTGTFDPRSREVQSVFSLENPDMSTLEELAGLELGGALKLEGNVSGPVARPRGSLSLAWSDLRLDTVRSDSLTLDLRGSPPDNESASLQGVVFTVEALARDLAVPGKAGTVGDVKLSLQGRAPAGDSITVSPLRLTAEGLALELRGEASPDGLDGRAQVALRAGDLASWASLAGLPDLAGAVDLEADVAWKNNRVSGSLELAGQSLRGIHPAADGLLAPRAELAAQFKMDDPSGLVLEPLALRSSGLELTATGTMNFADGKLDARSTVRLPDLGRLSSFLKKPASGSAELDAEASGSLEAMRVSARLKGRSLRMDKTRFDRLDLRVEASGLPGSPQGDLKVELAQDRLQASLASKFLLRDKLVQVSGLRLEAVGAKASADLSANLDTLLADGTVKATSRDLSALGKFLGLDLSGSLDLDARLAAVGKSQNVGIKLKADRLNAMGHRIRSARLDSDLRNVVKAPQGKADLELRGLVTGGATVDSLDLSLAGDAGKLTFDAKGKGKVLEPFRIATRGGMALGPSGEALDLRSLDGKFGPYPVALRKPALLRKSKKGVEVEGLDLRFGPARIEATGSLGGGRAKLDARLRDLPLDLARYGGVSQLSGTAQADLTLSGSMKRPDVKLNLDVKKVRWKDPRLEGIPALGAGLEARVGGGRADVSLSVRELTKKPLEATLKAPVTLALEPFAFSLPTKAPVEGTLRGQADLARLMSFYPLDGHSLKGLLQCDLGLSGSLERPAVQGNVKVEKGRYENVAMGTVLKDMEVALKGSDRELRVEKLSASDGGKGRLSGKGRVEVDAAKGFPLDLELLFDNARLVRRAEGTGVVNGDLKVSGNLGDMAVDGRLALAPAEINIPDHVPPSVPELEVVEINRPEGLPEPAKPEKSADETSSPPMNVNLKIDLDFPKRVYIRGRGLDSEWEGNLKIRGSASSPRITGKLGVVRGSLAFIDKELELSKSSVNFYGAQPPSPQLDISARSNTEDITAIIRITGDATKPDIAFTSEPPLPEDEVMARLLFGRSLDRLSPLQALQLADSLAVLSGKKGQSLNPLNRVRGALNLDQLDVGEGEQGETTLEVGKYLTERVYVDVEKKVGEDGGKASVEVEITPNISVESEMDTESEVGLGINWKYDY